MRDENDNTSNGNLGGAADAGNRNDRATARCRGGQSENGAATGRARKSGPKGGRPTLLTDALRDEMLERIALGEPVRQICLLPEMPDETTFYRWILKNKDFRDMYRVAKEAQMDRMEEALIEIADDARNDWMIREGERSGEKLVFHDEAVRRSQLRIATRQWLMSKLKSKKYGDRVEVTGEGAKTEVTVNLSLSKDRLEELQRRRREAMEGGNN